MYARFFNELPAGFATVAGVLEGDPLAWIPGARRRDGAIEVEVRAGGPLPAAVRKRVRLTVGRAVTAGDRVRVPIYWEATGPGFLFPRMDGELEVGPWEGGKTLMCVQVDYTPPLGAAGRALDEAVLHGLAASTLGAFRDGIAAALGASGGSGLEPPARTFAPATPRVAEVMTREVLHLAPTESIASAAARLRDRGVSGAPVVQGLEVLGYVSESDIIRATAPSETSLPRGADEAGARPVSEIMARRVVTVRPEDSAWTAARLIQRHRVKALPVVGALGRLEGIVARADLVRLVAGFAETDSAGAGLEDGVAANAGPGGAGAAP